MSIQRNIKVLIVDDSAVMRQMLTEILDSDPGLEVVGTAPDPYVARDKIKHLHPDVLTLDIEMPKMDGITFLKNLMRLRPMPVVMISSLTERGASATLDALAYGAFDFVTKPKVDVVERLEAYREEIVEKVKAAADARAHINQHRQDVHRLEGGRRSLTDSGYVIAIGASTGGTEAIATLLAALPQDAPPVLITQHIPAMFSGPFAQRMNRISRLSVGEAEDGARVLPGHAYIAPGGLHLELVKKGANLRCRLHDGPKVNRHRPSVDVLFNSVKEALEEKSVGVLLTGMGKDGAEGLLAMRESGAFTLCQNEASSVVWGMPGAAVKMGAALEVLPLDDIAGKIMSLKPGGH